jgi:hypothetical protein
LSRWPLYAGTGVAIPRIGPHGALTPPPPDGLFLGFGPTPAAVPWPADLYLLAGDRPLLYTLGPPADDRGDASPHPPTFHPLATVWEAKDAWEAPLGEEPLTLCLWAPRAGRVRLEVVAHADHPPIAAAVWIALPAQGSEVVRLPADQRVFAVQYGMNRIGLKRTGETAGRVIIRCSWVE